MNIETVLARAEENLLLMSRTANGIVDVSASPEKAKVMLVESSSRAADLARNNFETAFLYIRDHLKDPLESPDAVRSLIEHLALIINRGILKQGCLFRQKDVPGVPYICVAEMENYQKDFYYGLFVRLSDPLSDSVEAAAYTEFHINVGGHFFSDGCRKTAMAASAYVLLRRDHGLPLYRGGRPAYRAAIAAWQKNNLTKEEREACYRSFLSYYRKLFD